MNREFIGPDIDNSLITGNRIFALLVSPLLLFSVTAHPAIVPTIIPHQLERRFWDMLGYRRDKVQGSKYLEIPLVLPVRHLKPIDDRLITALKIFVHNMFRKNIAIEIPVYCCFAFHRTLNNRHR